MYYLYIIPTDVVILILQCTVVESLALFWTDSCYRININVSTCINYCFTTFWQHCGVLLKLGLRAKRHGRYNKNNRTCPRSSYWSKAVEEYKGTRKQLALVKRPTQCSIFVLTIIAMVRLNSAYFILSISRFGADIFCFFADIWIITVNHSSFPMWRRAYTRMPVNTC